MKTIIITGAANGVGKAIAEKLKNNKLLLIDEDVTKTVQYIFELPHEITMPSIEIRHIDNY